MVLSWCRQRESPGLYDWFDFQNASFELLDGDAEIRPGLSVITTPEPGQLPPGQAADQDTWHASVDRMLALSPARVHFCHHSDIVHG